jgi:Uma2 family endonuclease
MQVPPLSAARSRPHPLGDPQDRLPGREYVGAGTLAVMTTTPAPPPLASSAVEYPESDGQQMADNTLQWETIAYLVSALKLWFREHADVFVAGDLLWYYREGDPRQRVAPDGMVVFGRPAGYRGSYRQWEEAGIVPQVVFEVLSPNNTAREMQRKYGLYAQLGCEEYYLIDPDALAIEGFTRPGGTLTYLEDGIGFVSPRLGLRLGFTQDRFRLWTSDDMTLPSLNDAVDRADEEAARADEEAARADEQAARAAAALNEAARLRQRMIDLGIDPDAD